MSTLGKPDYEFYEMILKNEKFIKNLPRKFYLNVGFYFAMSKFNNIVLWRDYFEGVKKFSNSLNKLDIRMLKEMQNFFKLLDNREEYKEFDNFINKFKVSEKKIWI